MATDARDIAARLGLDVDAVRRLQARGYLLDFRLTRDEIRKRLHRALLGPGPGRDAPQRRESSSR